MFSFFRRIAQVSVLTFLCGATLAQQTLEFNSLDRKQGFPALLGGRAQYTDRINGTFTLPAGTASPVPVMVIMHGSGGINETTWEWSKFFLNMGIATFVVDSFVLRAIVSTGSDQSQLSYGATTVDALRALKTVAALPNVDATKIGVIGFSRGGVAALSSSFKSVTKHVSGLGDHKFALHVTFYPGCSQVGTTNQQPILYFVGDDDDFYPIAKCNAFVDTLKARGANLTYIVYPAAKHSFDLDRAQVYAPRVQTWGKCKETVMDLDNLSYSIEGLKVTSKEFGEYLGKCMTTGLTLGPDSKAKKDSREKVEGFVRKNFAM